MFCYQCEQTAQGTGCTSAGVCGKDGATATLQDVLTHVAKGIAHYAHRARQAGRPDREADDFVISALFTTVTNVDFDADRIEGLIRQGVRLRDRVRSLWAEARRGSEDAQAEPRGPAQWQPAADRAGLLVQAVETGLSARRSRHGEDVAGLQELVLYGLKGMAAYADHARILGNTDEAVAAFFHEILNTLADEPAQVEVLLGLALRVGEMNLRTMEQLDAAHTSTFGHPVPTRVRVTAKAGKAILISGHDLRDLELLLQQTEGKGILVYTHGEMLPAHGYPELKKYPHLTGNYGGAWQDQRREFAEFPGAILMTTNCIQRPQASYQDRIFTTGLVGWPGVRHLGDKDFSPLIGAALAAPGFAQDEPERTITVGFGHHTVLGLADKIVAAVKAGSIKHVYLIGGCDGAKPGRNAYTQAAQAVPEDSVILTLACGKYRFNQLEFGDIAGIPRLLDIGQCNDAYSAIRIAQALAEAFGTDVNGLPLTFLLSWYEQKAVAILLTLLFLGVKNMRLGPTLPAFLTPAVVETLSRAYGLQPLGDPAREMPAVKS